ncbi:MAG: hypothetical protein KBB88_01715 [Candidatus Pacebacteria bacterium]|nr:hypothetical protein [Candidatus Paceibacterota bacterium]
MKNIYVFLVVLVLSDIALSQSDTNDSLVQTEIIKGYFHSATQMVIKSIKPNTDKLFIGEKLETIFLSKNKHLGAGISIETYHLADKNEIQIDPSQNSFCLTTSYRSFFAKNLVFTSGIGVTSKKLLAYTGSIRYCTRNCFTRSDVVFDAYIRSLPEYVNYTVLAYLVQDNFLYGACFDNKKLNGIIFGVFRDWLMFQCIVSAKKIERSFLFSTAIQVDITFDFIEKNVIK